MIKRNLLGGALIVSVLFLFTGCKEIMSHLDNSVDSHLQVADKVTVIGVGKTYQIAKDVDYTTISDAGPTFESLDKTVATVDSKTGLVTALKSGDARIKISLPDNGLYLDASAIIGIKVRVQDTDGFIKNVAALADEDVILLAEGAAIELKDPADFSGKKVAIKGVENKPAKIKLNKDIIISDDFVLENVSIDASESTKPFISLAATPTTTAVNDCYFIDNVIIKNTEIKDIQTYFIYSSSQTRYVVKNMLIDDCVVRLKTNYSNVEKKEQYAALIRLNNNQSGVKDFTVQNSTFYQTGVSNPQYFVQYSQGDPARWKLADEETWSFNYYNNTFYGVTTGNWANTGRTNNVKGRTIFNLKKNIWVDCGNGQTVQRILNQQASGFKEANFEYNTYWKDGAAVDQSSYDKSGKILTTDPNFKDAANGDFTPQGDKQVENKTGDPRWLK